jgi:hypothetical protein
MTTTSKWGHEECSYFAVSNSLLTINCIRMNLLRPSLMYFNKSCQVLKNLRFVMRYWNVSLLVMNRVKLSNITVTQEPYILASYSKCRFSFILMLNVRNWLYISFASWEANQSSVVLQFGQCLHSPQCGYLLLCSVWLLVARNNKNSRVVN